MYTSTSFNIISYFFNTLDKVVYEGDSKSSKPHPGRRVIAEHFCYDNILPFLKKHKKI